MYFSARSAATKRPNGRARCPSCGAWNTLVEQAVGDGAKAKTGGRSRALRAKAHPIAELDTAQEIRFPTGMGELDRVLGGGAVQGSLVLVGGAPGIGKSTLMLQICGKLSENAKILYVSGEESPRQLKLRADRLGVQSDNLYVLSETCLGDVLESVEEEKPDVLIVDSIQTLYQDSLESPAGSVAPGARLHAGADAAGQRGGHHRLCHRARQQRGFYCGPEGVGAHGRLRFIFRG